MITLKIRYTICIMLLSGILFSACKKGWDEHNAITDEALNKTLLQQITETSDLSSFNNCLVKTGYDKVLASSNSFTVWAPTNTAMQNIDPAVLTDTAKLKQFVQNHIEYPQAAIDNGVEGTVNVTFAVDEQGKVYSPAIKGEKLGYGLEDEAMRVVNQMPKWTPGRIKGQNVKTYYTLPITFTLL